MDVAAWLRGLGLEQYAPAFRDNDVDGEVLPELTSDDLIGIGVTSVGHRRKLLAAIAALGTEPPTVAQSAASATSAPTSPPTIDAERRQLTVMFCDLVGSTLLATRLDPEDLREVVSAYHRAVAEIVAGLDGFVAKYMGDGVLIYFGYPRAHEDDAERAVLAGLGVIDAIARLDISERLEVRLGIATGLAVVGDLIGAGASEERGVVGETPNLAARLQAMAAPNTLVIADATRRQVGGLFDLADLRPQALAGFAEPQPAWRVLGESGVLSRFEALRSGTTPLVGRGEELDLLLRRWEQAKTGEGRVVLLSGEPGIGKSRLTAALYEHVEGEPHTRLRYFCSPHYQDSALYPVIGQLERAAGFARDDTAAQKLTKLESVLAADARCADDIALLGDLLSVPGAASDLGLSPQRKRERTFDALLRQLDALARRRPVLLVFEDVHWVDPTSRELLDLMVERSRSLLVLLMVTCRPEFQHGWSGRPHVTVLTLNRLGGREGAALVQGLAGNTGLTSEMIAEIVERTDGVPLFVEELTKAVLESAEPGDRVAAVLAATSLAALSVPATLHASLIARLDRLGQAPKEIAQIGAVLGRDFTYDLIRPVAQRQEAELRAALDRLSEAGLLLCRGVAPHSSYLFKHALVQDAAYGTLLRGRRQELHGRVADALLAASGQAPDTAPEIVAHHLQNAGRSVEAIAYWRQAGERAIARSENLEAIAHLTRGLGVLNTLPEGPQRDEQELLFQTALVAPHWARNGWASPGAERAARRASELCREMGAETPEHLRALWGLAAFYMVRGELRTGRGLGERCLQLAERLQDPGLLGYAHFLMGDFLLWSPELAAARGYLEQGIALYEPGRDRSEAARFGFDNGMASHSFLGRVLWHLGYPDQGLSHAEQAIAIARDASHPFSEAWALSWTAALHQLRREAGRVQELADADLALATEQVIPFFGAHAMVMRGWALVEQGQGEEGMARLREGLAAYRATGAEIERSHWLGLMAEACGRTEQIEEGLRVVSEALAEIDQNGIRYYEAELHRLEGGLRLRLEMADEQRAETCFRKAIDIACQQQAKSFELRAAKSLARLWGEQGRRAEAHALLAPIYGWFTEGFDTPDLKDAKALLDELV